MRLSKRAARVAALASLFLDFLPLASGAPFQDCRWDSAVRSGELDPRMIGEASGLEVSTLFPGRLYHVNDSGDLGRFYITDSGGAGARIVNVDSFDPYDVEDLSLGPCGAIEGSCLFIADIGDNFGVRGEVEIALVQEQEEFGERTLPVDAFRVAYPDGPHDAESLAVHPNGDLFILTKERSDSMRMAWPSRLYRLGYERWSGVGGRTHQLEFVGEIDLTAINNSRYSGSIPTALDISDDGSRFIVLTYFHAFEFYLDLSRGSLPETADMVEGVDFRRIRLDVLDQQEGVAYLGRNAILYDTEDGPAGTPIMRVRCR